MQVNPKNKIKQAVFWLMMLYGQRFLSFSFDSLLSKSFYTKNWRVVDGSRKLGKTHWGRSKVSNVYALLLWVLSYLHIHNSSEMLRSFKRQSIFFVKSNISKWNCWEYFYALFSAVKKHKRIFSSKQSFISCFEIAKSNFLFK